jgi:hypothetical protein
MMSPVWCFGCEIPLYGYIFYGTFHNSVLFVSSEPTPFRCDNSINEACEMLGSFELIEEVINSVFGRFL